MDANLLPEPKEQVAGEVWKFYSANSAVLGTEPFFLTKLPQNELLLLFINNHAKYEIVFLSAQLNVRLNRRKFDSHQLF